MLVTLPLLVSLVVPAVCNAPSAKFNVATPLLVPDVELVRVKVLTALSAVRSKVKSPPVTGTLVSERLISANVLAPLNVCVVPKSATVIVPSGSVAVVPEPVVDCSDTLPAPATAKL